ncbi:MAG: GNAT family N-acetyltransferase [Clostridiaceae bacterium]|jgi:RimJ/RimL family protein N-acetyltransferase|nr:GNAT family N-acetyltransferase [Clostridiaceae bacterium]
MSERYFKKLVGDRIYLSPKNLDDTEQYTVWLNDFRVTDGLQGENLISVVKEKAWLEESLRSESRDFAIVRLSDDKLIGNCGFNNIDPRNRYGEIGLFIGEEDDRNHGLGGEAVGLLLDYGFNYLNLHSIALSAYGFNKRALACYKKAGFKETGVRRERRFVNGKYYDEIMLDILETEFHGDNIRNKNLK